MSKNLTYRRLKRKEKGESRKFDPSFYGNPNRAKKKIVELTNIKSRIRRRRIKNGKKNQG